MTISKFFVNTYSIANYFHRSANTTVRFINREITAIYTSARMDDIHTVVIQAPEIY